MSRTDESERRGGVSDQLGISIETVRLGECDPPADP
jgi:hypothetical protein